MIIIQWIITSDYSMMIFFLSWIIIQFSSDFFSSILVTLYKSIYINSLLTVMDSILMTLNINFLSSTLLIIAALRTKRSKHFFLPFNVFCNSRLYHLILSSIWKFKVIISLKLKLLLLLFVAGYIGREFCSNFLVIGR